MAQLCDLFATRAWPETTARDRIFTWSGDLSPSGESIPLRLAGALHALRLQGKALMTAYPPHKTTDDDLWRAVTTALITHDDFICDWIKSAPQTNEVRRSAAIIPVGRALAARYGVPIRTSELGASGGLNMKWDHYGLSVGGQDFGSDDIMMLTPEWTGPLPDDATPNVINRTGVDLNPLDPRDAGDALRLQAYLWPDQPDRMARTRAAISIADTHVDKGDAIDWLAPRLPHEAGVLHLVYHTVAWQYFPADVQAKGTALIEAAGATATDNTPLAWFAMENDGAMKGAALTLRLWPGDHHFDLGRADFHGRWIDWKGM